MAKRAFSDFIGFSRASAAWRFNSSGVLVQEAANVARDDYDPVSGLWNGLLIEEARTNLIRNSSMISAVVGTPGTIPSNWAIYGVGSLVQQIIGIGSESGIPYIDYRVSGTSNTTEIGITLETNGIAAALGQSWTCSSFVRLVGGSMSNVSNIRLVMEERDAPNTFLSELMAVIAPTSASLANSRFSLAKPLPGATTAFVRPMIKFAIANAAAIDFTLRIGAPQLEQGAFATSPILTTNAQVTRAADTVVVGSLQPWFNPSEGTVYAEFVVSQLGRNSGAFAFHDGSNSNRILVYATGAGQVVVIVNTNGATVSVVGPTIAAGAVVKVALAYANNSIVICVNGAAPITAGAGMTVPVINSLRLGGAQFSTTGDLLNGWLRALKYNPRRMTNAELQTMTTLPNANGPTLAFDFKAKTFNLEHI